MRLTIAKVPRLSEITCFTVVLHEHLVLKYFFFGGNKCEHSILEVVLSFNIPKFRKSLHDSLARDSSEQRFSKSGS